MWVQQFLSGLGVERVKERHRDRETEGERERANGMAVMLAIPRINDIPMTSK